MINKFRESVTSRLLVGSFSRNVVTLMTGTSFAQALTIIVAPVLTRLYSPEDFGMFALYTSLLGILSIVACWRYELAIVLPEKDEDAANILALCILICFGMTSLIIILVAFLGNPIAKVLGAPELAHWLWFMPLSVLAGGLFQAFNYWSTRRMQFKRLAMRTITLSTVSVSTQIGVGAILPLGPGGLISGSIIGQLSATGQLAFQIGRDEGKHLHLLINWAEIKRMFNQYRDFLIYSSWSGILNTASSMLPALLLGYFFNPIAVGYYALGYRILAMPMGVVGGSIAQVFFPSALEARRAGSLEELTFDMFQRLLSLGFVPILLITIVAPDLFLVIFGSNWWEAGEYVRWMSVWLFFVFISSPLSMLYTVMEQQKVGLILNITIFSSRILVFTIGGIKGDAHFTIALLGISGVILYVFNCTYILFLAGVPALRVYNAILKQIVLGVPYAVLPLLVKSCSDSSIAFVFASIVSGMIFLLVMACMTEKKAL